VDAPVTASKPVCVSVLDVNTRKKKMTKLCKRGKEAAKRKFDVYPSAYANAYASKICAGKIKDPSGKKRKDFKGPKPMATGGSVSQQRKKVSNYNQGGVAKGCGMVMENRRKVTKKM
jgi:hypothetical protein